MALAKEEKKEIIKKFAREKGDTGSPEVQIALLSMRIDIKRTQKRCSLKKGTS